MLLMKRNFAFDTICQGAAQSDGGDQQFAIGRIAGIASQHVEKRGHIGAYLGLAGEEAEILINFGGRRIVIACAEMDIAAQTWASLRTTIATLAWVFRPIIP